MPKASKHPKLRVSIKRGKAGQVWTSYWYDNRGTGKPDVPLGTDRTEALRRWAELHLDAPRLAGTLEEAFRGWEQRGLTHRRDGTARSAVTVRGYTACLRAMREAFGPARWDEVTLPVLVRYIAARSAKRRATQEMQVLSVIWGWARLEGLTALPWPADGMGHSGWKGPASVRHAVVTDAAFAAIYRHADQCLRDALDIATATGLRVGDVLELRITDVRDGKLMVAANKTGKRAEFELAGSVLLSVIERRRKLRGPEHVFLLAAGKRKVTYPRLAARWDKARAAAALECPEVAGLYLRDMRKRASVLAGSLQAASTLLQHSSLGVTSRHYPSADTIKPVR